uniref:MADF domain-containing protein n=1 Tax=Knipowitschia caucasica TaxID=637954 RepID=A0AAV2MAE7_KNICA
MDHVEERLCEEVRRYVHIYDANSRDYKDAQMTGNLWREISQTLGMDVAECQRRWRLVRYKFVRLKKKMVGRSGEAGDGQKVPGLFHSLSWLSPYVRHRERQTSTNVTERQSGEGLKVRAGGAGSSQNDEDSADIRRLCSA